ncbi:CinA family protein [Alcanivorax sp. JB21]|uniref:CinA family protein n=1 Tax=Alcanivorax limicola TaxID=2874102 RepID=UPI001CC08C25|nr:CinA family protein [Alcanivorax limicola]MBZ2188261.1 CinA family protein [Alcanivorax limicola]
MQQDLARRTGLALKTAGWTMATAESCTGGGIAAAMTDIAGSSEWLDSGFVTYSNAAKMRLLGVPASVLAEHGAVSEATVRAMAEGVLARSPVNIAVAVSGIAGPDGGSTDKPVGTVWFAWARREQGSDAVVTDVARHVLGGDRAAVRAATVKTALEGILERVPGVSQA